MPIEMQRRAGSAAMAKRWTQDANVLKPLDVRCELPRLGEERLRYQGTLWDCKSKGSH